MHINGSSLMCLFGQNGQHGCGGLFLFCPALTVFHYNDQARTASICKLAVKMSAFNCCTVYQTNSLH